MRQAALVAMTALLLASGAACRPDPALSGTVTVPAAGQAFDPPISRLRLPEGAWYCDMGTVEYARMEQGDGVCPVCGMALEHNVTAAH